MKELLELIGITVSPLTDADRKLIENVLTHLHAKYAEEVHWPTPRPAMEGPNGEGLWLSRWIARRAGRRG
jgi:hypothetical protein